MSHFTVGVITPGKPSDEELAALLQPFHEFECTGADDQYVVDVDVTEDAREEWQKSTALRYRDPDGGLHDPYENRFYRAPLPDENPGFGTGSNGRISWHSRDWDDGQGYRPKVHFVPDGWTEIEVPTPEVQAFADWVQGYYGLEPVLPGGREKFGFVEIDLSGEVVRAIKRTNPNKKWDWWVVGGRWRDSLSLKDGSAADQARIGDLSGERRPTFAVLKDGQWYERGQMLWFACVADEKPEDQWDAEYRKLLAGSPDAWLTVVDCHI